MVIRRSVTATILCWPPPRSPTTSPTSPPPPSRQCAPPPTTSCTPPLTVGSTRTVSLRLIPRSRTARYTYGRESPTNTPPETPRTTPSAASPSTSSKSSVPYSDCSGAPAAPLRSMTSDISVIRSYTFHIVYERIQVRLFAVIWGRQRSFSVSRG